MIPYMLLRKSFAIPSLVIILVVKINGSISFSIDQTHKNEAIRLGTWEIYDEVHRNG
jgi:hypothetical protein